MMHLRAFLYAQDHSGEWFVTVFRELEPLIEAATASVVEGARSAAIHVGFWRPETVEVAALASETLGALLVSGSAACALPAPLSLSLNVVGTASGIGFKLALDGFGYTIADPTIAAGVSVDLEGVELAPGVTSEVQPAQGWVAQMGSIDPDLGAAASDAGVWDESSYQANERLLPPELRFRIGMARMSTLLHRPVDETNILEHLWACPPWFMDVSFNELNLNLRERHVLEADNQHVVGDLTAVGESGLLKIPNCGRKSVANIAKELLESLRQGVGLQRSASMGTLPPPRVGDFTAPSRAPGHATLGPFEKYDCASLRAGFLSIVTTLGANEFEVWTGRFGIRCEAMTLQQIADRMRVSRERVRQIEYSVNKRLASHPFWEVLSQRLDGALAERDSALLIAGLSAVDPWFDSAESFTASLAMAFKSMLDSQFATFEVGGSWIVTRLGFEEWKQACASARAILEDGAASRIEKDYARSMCDSLLVGKGEELRGELWAVATHRAIWSSPPDGVSRLVALGRGAEGVVQAVLESSGRPLHYSEIHRRASSSTPIAHDLRRITNAAQEVGMLYGRGTFGLRSHCPLTEEELALIRAEVDDLMAGGNPSRQWHASELTDAMFERGLGFGGRLTKYILNIALKDSSDVVYLGRMVWAIKKVDSLDPPSRLDVRQAVLALLEQEGRPLSTAEIRQRIFAGRGVNRTFQIQPADELVRLGSGLWGISTRDIDIGSSKALLARLRAKLIETQRGIHVSEMPDRLGLGVDAGEVMDRSLLALAHTEGLRIDRGQYAYLHEWGGSRRVSAPDAARTILSEAGEDGVTLDRVCARLNDLVERTIPREYAIQTLRGVDAVFDSQRSLWIEGSAERDDIDAEPGVAMDEGSLSSKAYGSGSATVSFAA